MENFLEPVAEEIEFLQDIMNLYPARIIDKMGLRPWADPFVIACARHYKLPVIQHEKSLDPNQCKIPFIAKKFKIDCLTLVEFFKEENWTFIEG